MLEGDARDFVERATAEKVTLAMLVTKDRDHMGVVNAVLTAKFTVP